MGAQGIFGGEQGPPWETLISPWDLFVSQGEQPVLDKEGLELLQHLSCVEMCHNSIAIKLIIIK